MSALLAFFCCISVVLAQSTSLDASDYEKQKIALSPSYFLSVSCNTENITVLLETTSTDGWLGFGISPSKTDPAMSGSDIVMGHVSADGTAVVSDRHATGYSQPVLDSQNDLFGVSSSRTSQSMKIAFQRARYTGSFSFFLI